VKAEVRAPQASVYVYELQNNDVKVEKLEFVKAAA